MPIVQRRGHKIGEEIGSPAYVDANFLIYYSVGSNQAPNLQTVARNIMGDLLVQKVTIMVSLITIQEAWWGTLGELFCRHVWSPVTSGEQCYLNRQRARRHWTQLMYYRNDLEKIVGCLEKLRDNGAPICFVPKSEVSLEACCKVPSIMEKHGLFPADALHLSLALSQAKTLITFDVEDFRRVVDPAENLTIIALP